MKEKIAYNHKLLRTLRLAQDVTQETVATAIDYHVQSVSRAERGVYAGFLLLRKLADYYGIPVSSLLEAQTEDKTDGQTKTAN